MLNCKLWIAQTNVIFEKKKKLKSRNSYRYRIRDSIRGLGGVESNSKPEGRSKKFRPRGRSPRGRNFSDLPEGLEFDLRPPIRIELDSYIVTDPSPYGIS